MKTGLKDYRTRKDIKSERRRTKAEIKYHLQCLKRLKTWHGFLVKHEREFNNLK